MRIRRRCGGQDSTTKKRLMLEEIAMYFAGRAHRLYERLMEAHFGNHPLSMSILGTNESIQKLQRDEMADYFRKRYGPGNMVLSATGRLEFDEIVRLPEKYCGSCPHVEEPRHRAHPTSKPRRLSVTRGQVNRQCA